MPRPDRTLLHTFIGHHVDDLIGDNPRLLFVGINPGLWTAATNTHFAYPGNRFYPALVAAKLIETPHDPAGGSSSAERLHLTKRGIGITNIVARATARAEELTKDEIRDGGLRLIRRIECHRPRVVAVLGLTAYRTAFGVPNAQRGEQPEQQLGGARTFVYGNPSGLNAHETVDRLATAFREAAAAAGIELLP